MDWIARFCMLPPRPVRSGADPDPPGGAVVVFLPTSAPLSGAGYILDRLEQDCILLSLPRTLRDLARPYRHFGGNCWKADMLDLAWCGAESPDDFSPLWLWEDGGVLGPAHQAHQTIADQGRGRFSHWGRRVFFSASDNTDPNTNGRRYQVGFQAPPDLVGLADQDQTRGEGRARERGKAETYSFTLGPGNRITLPPQCLGSPLWAKAVLAVDLNPWAGLAWPNRRYLRGLGLRRLLFRRGLEWTEISLADPAKTRIRSLAGAGLGMIGGFLEGRGFGPEPVGRVAILGRAAGYLSLGGVRMGGRAPGARVGPARTRDVIGLFGKRIAEDNALFSQSGSSAGQSPLKMVFYIGGLATGGTERGLAVLAAAAKSQGHEVRVLTTHKPLAQPAPFREYLENRGIPVARAGSSDLGRILGKAARSRELKPNMLSITPLEFRAEVADLLGDLLLWPPDALLCFLDQPNIIGGVAGFLAGVERIVFSVQNMNPSRFPGYFKPWMRDWYRLLAGSRRICLSAISRGSALDYAEWLGLEPSRLRVVRLGLDFPGMVPPTPEERAAFRGGLGIGESDFLVAGAFRLSPEKRPERFLEVVKKVAAQGIGVKAVIAGEGPLADQLRSQIDRLGLADRVIPLGLREDIYKVMGCCDALLQTSEMEGLSLSLLEAQYLGLPVVATEVGGTSEAVISGRSGVLHPQDDIQGMADSLVRIARDKDLARAMGAAGRSFVADNFSKDRMLAQTMDLLDQGFGQAGERNRG